MENKFDVLVIGGGPAGYTAAINAAQNGFTVVLAEMSKMGGTCLNRGCVPTKALIHSGELIENAKQMQNAGINVNNVGHDLNKIYDRRDEIVNRLRDGLTKFVSSKKVVIKEGCAQFVDKNTVKINEEIFTAKNIIIASGSVPATLPIEGIEHCVNSDYFLENKNEIPQNVLIVGGGIIGVEFAEFMLSLGTNITIVEYMDRLISNMDKDVSLQLAMALKRKGASIYTGAAVTKVEKTEKGYKVHFTDKKGFQTADSDIVLVSTGRKANISNLNAQAIGLETVKGCIKVDENYQTNISNIYAIGDCIGGIQLAHFAAAQGAFVADKIAGKENPLNLKVIPSCIYTSPEIASVGISQVSAVEKGIEVEVGKTPMGANAKSLIAGAERGFVKTIFEKQTDKLIGAVLYCDRATDIIGQLCLAIANGLTRKELLKVIHPHPTVEEAVGESVLASIKD